MENEIGAGLGIFSALIGITVLGLFIWLDVRILHRAGRSGWWVLTMFIPLVNIIMLWVFAFTRWPAVDGEV